MKLKKQSTPLWHYLLPPAILGVITSVIYYPSLHYDFQFDDIANITKHFDIRHNTFSKLFFSGTRWISYWINAIHYSIGRFDPYSYRVFNVALHIAIASLIYFLLSTLLSNLKKESLFKLHARSLAFVTALLFAIHPVQTQTVSYVIQGQLEGLATLCILLMSLCYYFLYTTKKTHLKTPLKVLLFVIALFSCGTKEIAIISPVLLAVTDWFFIAQGDWTSFKQRIPLLATLLVFVVGIYTWFLKPSFFTEILGLQKVAKNNIGNIITHNPKDKITPWAFFISQFKVLIHYLWMFIWPFNISVEYDWMLCKSFFSPDCLLPLAGLLAIAFVCVQLLKKDNANMHTFGLAWFFTCMAPRSSIIPSSELLVDYKTYMGSIGIYFLLATVLVVVFERLTAYTKNISLQLVGTTGHLALAVLCALPISWQAQERNTVWRSGLDFWGNIIQNAPGKARAYNNYGVDLAQKCKKFKEAIPYFEKAIAMDNSYSDPCNNLAVSYGALGQIDKAINALHKSLKINPYYPEGYNNIASFLLQKNELDKAEKALKTAIKIRPYYGKAHYNLGRVYLSKGDKQKAHACFKTACTKGDLDTDYGYSVYGKMSLDLQKYDEAIFAYKKTLQLNPQFKDAQLNLANAYFCKGGLTQAEQAYKAVLASNPHDQRARYNLAETYAKFGNIQKSAELLAAIPQVAPQYSKAQLRLARCYEQLRQPQKSINTLQHLLSLKGVPNNTKKLSQNLLKQLKAKYKQA